MRCPADAGGARCCGELLRWDSRGRGRRFGSRARGGRATAQTGAGTRWGPGSTNDRQRTPARARSDRRPVGWAAPRGRRPLGADGRRGDARPAASRRRRVPSHRLRPGGDGAGHDRPGGRADGVLAGQGRADRGGRARRPPDGAPGDGHRPGVGGQGRAARGRCAGNGSGARGRRAKRGGSRVRAGRGRGGQRVESDRLDPDGRRHRSRADGAAHPEVDATERCAAARGGAVSCPWRGAQSGHRHVRRRSRRHGRLVRHHGPAGGGRTAGRRGRPGAAASESCPDLRRQPVHPAVRCRPAAAANRRGRQRGRDPPRRGAVVPERLARSRVRPVDLAR